MNESYTIEYLDSFVLNDSLTNDNDILFPNTNLLIEDLPSFSVPNTPTPQQRQNKNSLKKSSLQNNRNTATTPPPKLPSTTTPFVVTPHTKFVPNSNSSFYDSASSPDEAEAFLIDEQFQKLVDQLDQDELDLDKSRIIDFERNVKSLQTTADQNFSSTFDDEISSFVGLVNGINHEDERHNHEQELNFKKSDEEEQQQSSITFDEDELNGLDDQELNSRTSLNNEDDDEKHQQSSLITFDEDELNGLDDSINEITKPSHHITTKHPDISDSQHHNELNLESLQHELDQISHVLSSPTAQHPQSMSTSSVFSSPAMIAPSAEIVTGANFLSKSSSVDNINFQYLDNTLDISTETPPPNLFQQQLFHQQQLAQDENDVDVEIGNVDQENERLDLAGDISDIEHEFFDDGEYEKTDGNQHHSSSTLNGINQRGSAAGEEGNEMQSMDLNEILSDNKRLTIDKQAMEKEIDELHHQISTMQSERTHHLQQIDTLQRTTSQQLSEITSLKHHLLSTQSQLESISSIRTTLAQEHELQFLSLKKELLESKESQLLVLRQEFLKELNKCEEDEKVKWSKVVEELKARVERCWSEKVLEREKREGVESELERVKGERKGCVGRDVVVQVRDEVARCLGEDLVGGDAEMDSGSLLEGIVEMTKRYVVKMKDRLVYLNDEVIREKAERERVVKQQVENVKFEMERENKEVVSKIRKACEDRVRQVEVTMGEKLNEIRLKLIEESQNQKLVTVKDIEALESQHAQIISELKTQYTNQLATLQSHWNTDRELLTTKITHLQSQLTHQQSNSPSHPRSSTPTRSQTPKNGYHDSSPTKFHTKSTTSSSNSNNNNRDGEQWKQFYLTQFEIAKEKLVHNMMEYEEKLRGMLKGQLEQVVSKYKTREKDMKVQGEELRAAFVKEKRKCVEYEKRIQKQMTQIANQHQQLTTLSSKYNSEMHLIIQKMKTEYLKTLTLMRDDVAANKKKREERMAKEWNLKKEKLEVEWREKVEVLRRTIERLGHIPPI